MNIQLNNDMNIIFDVTNDGDCAVRLVDTDGEILREKVVRTEKILEYLYTDKPEKTMSAIDYSNGLIADIERELKVIQAIWDGRITFGNEGEGDIVCHIGEYWFYFYDGRDYYYIHDRELEARDITPENINSLIPMMELATMIREAIEGLEDDEYEYYCEILQW